MILLKKSCLLNCRCLLLLLFSLWRPARSQGPQPPLNGPCAVSMRNGQLLISYDNRRLLEAAVDPKQVSFLHIENRTANRVEQVFVLESGDGAEFELEGQIQGSEESFACEADNPPKAVALVRHSSGESKSLLNRAVYDRSRDWVLSFDLPAPVSLEPAGTSEGRHIYHFHVKTSKLSIRFRPRFYQYHKGLTYFEPWTYRIWDKPVVGWCSWFAYLNKVTEQNIRTVADSLSSVLLPYGYQYLQIDDGYQQEPIGKPEHWLQPNNKFPSGMAALSRYISDRGLKPGIWTNVSFADSAFANAHPDWFVRNDRQKPVSGEWVGYVMDGSNPATIDHLIRPVYDSLKKEGWNYFKVDALRHLRYEGYNSYPSYFKARGISREDAFRSVVTSIRKSVGKDNYLLACWGIRPELIGLVDGCRIGNDGFSYAGLAQFNSFNNVVWRNDPDHVELTDAEAFRSCSVTSLTGSVLLLTDKPERYKGPILEAARRTSPVLFTRPAQVYEVDPSRIQSLGRYPMEVSGDGPRVFDASYTPFTELYSLELTRPFGNWLVLGRMNDRHARLPLSELGLQADSTYEVFEFWTRTYLGRVKKELVFPAIDAAYNCQVFCLRKAVSHPQLLATNRHISCGGVELISCDWKGGLLSGQSELVAGDEYDIYIQVPSGYRPGKISTEADLLGSKLENSLLTVRMKSKQARTISWEIEFLQP